MPTKYTNASLDEEMTNDLLKIHEKCLAPLGIKYSNPAVIRHLIKFHNFTNGIHADLQHDAMINWKEDQDNE